jgi:lipopolysaccharide/colanic/teichoic acid biosynthesis glycosyltransferase
MLKRLFDLLISTVALIVLFPFFLGVACVIKWDSSGPVFFRQIRVGKNEQHFRIFKLRTMRTESFSLTSQITVSGDPRITRVGHILRKTKLDELAQLIDVWRGTMSLVGPRPEVPRYVALYPLKVKEKILSVRPGITDWASLKYRNENDLFMHSENPDKEYIEVIMPAKLELAVRYVEQQSLITDVRILFSTLKILLLKR